MSTDERRHSRLPIGRLRAFRRVAAGSLLLLALVSGPALADPSRGFAARAGLDLAAAAARAWAPDAYLVYVENDEDLDPLGASTRWGYLFYSPALEKARGYSIRDGRILVAEDLGMKFEAPPLATDWMDSAVALEVAERGAGRKFCEERHARLSTMLLMRGAFSETDPDQTTWTLVYTSPGAPSLFVVVDAREGKVRRTWRG